MRRRSLAAVLVALVLLGVRGITSALADAAPPQNPPGASIAKGQAETKVQMVSENVLMTIDDYQSNGAQEPGSMPPFMRGHVDATFVMLNRGDSAEAFDVWFPTGVSTGYSGVATVDNFKAWVDNVPATAIGRAETRDEFDNQVPWATWPASFPPGQQVTLRVTYDTYATGYAPYGRLEYILATGAGWYGSIGEGTVTFRLPYDVDEMNAAIQEGELYWLPTGGPFTVSGTDVVWHFTDLEPTTANNITLVVLAPATWRKIAAARQAAAANPTSIQAQLGLAEAAREGLQYKYSLQKIGGTMKLVDLAAEAYSAAIELDPTNLDTLIECLDLLDGSRDFDADDPDPRFAPLLDRALRIAPDNAHLKELQARLAERNANQAQRAEYQLSLTGIPIDQATYFAPMTATANITATAAEALRLTPLPSSTLAEGVTPAESATPTNAPTPATPTPTPTPIPAPAADQSGNVQDWNSIGLPAVIIAIIIATWLRRRRTPQPQEPEQNHTSGS